jgi:hypothetical protein
MDYDLGYEYGLGYAFWIVCGLEPGLGWGLEYGRHGRRCRLGCYLEYESGHGRGCGLFRICIRIWGRIGVMLIGLWIRMMVGIWIRIFIRIWIRVRTYTWF